MWTTPDDISKETNALERRLKALDTEVAGLETRLTATRDQRDRVRTALNAVGR